MSGRFHLKTASDGKYHFNLLAGNGEIILTSELFKSKSEALNSIESVRINSQIDDCFELKETPNGGYHFRLIEPSGRTIGISQLYSSRASAEAGIISVKAHAKKSTELDIANTPPIEAIGSVRTFLTAIGYIEPERDNAIFYRGHGNSEYSLTPGIYRNSGWIKNENTMFHELLLRCPSDFNMSGSTFNTLVKMQHYSLPTRLLDITANPLIALYFACEDGETHDAEVIAFRIPKEEIKYYDSDTVSVASNISRMPSTFAAKKDFSISRFNRNPEIIRLVREIQREKPYFENRVESIHIRSVVCVKPMLDNPRIIKQDGAFFLFGMDNEKTSAAKVPERYLASKDDLRMIIRGSDKRKILQQLELLGITRSSIYPEIEHVAGHIRNTYINY